MYTGNVLKKERKRKVIAGDLVCLNRLHTSMCGIAMIVKVHKTDMGLGQIYLLTRVGVITIPWIKRGTYIDEVG